MALLRSQNRFHSDVIDELSGGVGGVAQQGSIVLAI